MKCQITNGRMGGRPIDDRQVLEYLAQRLRQGEFVSASVLGVLHSLAERVSRGLDSVRQADQTNQPRNAAAGLRDVRASDACSPLREHVLTWDRKRVSDGIHCSHVGSIVLHRSGHIVDRDQRAASMLDSGKVLKQVDGKLRCASRSMQERLLAALAKLFETERSASVLLFDPTRDEQRFSVTLRRLRTRHSCPVVGGSDERSPEVLCLVAPLDGRRLATARQLMDLFGLTAAEARLARALANGGSVDEYAREQELRLPTVRTQLRAIFMKTDTDRQHALVRLITGIPAVRDSA
jgi:DNA-binding CsgD family transcriptional regulator